MNLLEPWGCLSQAVQRSVITHRTTSHVKGLCVTNELQMNGLGSTHSNQPVETLSCGNMCMEPVWTLHRPSCMCTILVVCLGLSTHFNLLLNSKGEQHVSTNSKTHSYFQVRSSLLLVPKNVRNCNSPKPHRARSLQVETGQLPFTQYIF